METLHACVVEKIAIDGASYDNENNRLVYPIKINDGEWEQLSLYYDGKGTIEWIKSGLKFPIHYTEKSVEHFMEKLLMPLIGMKSYKLVQEHDSEYTVWFRLIN